MAVYEIEQSALDVVDLQSLLDKKLKAVQQQFEHYVATISHSFLWYDEEVLAAFYEDLTSKLRQVIARIQQPSEIPSTLYKFEAGTDNVS